MPKNWRRRTPRLRVGNGKVCMLVEVQPERIDQLEKLVADIRHDGKRQATPVSKSASPTRSLRAASRVLIDARL
jgi:hypothetical protein